MAASHIYCPQEDLHHRSDQTEMEIEMKKKMKTEEKKYDDDDEDKDKDYDDALSYITVVSYTNAVCMFVIFCKFVCM